LVEPQARCRRVGLAGWRAKQSGLFEPSAGRRMLKCSSRVPRRLQIRVRLPAEADTRDRIAWSSG